MYIYIHIPFCSSICSYCDFPKLLYDNKYINNYLDCLEKEINNRYQNEKVVSIYIGGGTPTCLNYKELEKLLKLTQKFNADKEIEFTIESNIESLNKEKIKLLKKYKINRISLGVQSFQKDILKELNRHHTNEEVQEVIKELKENKFKNISIDYIYGVNDNIKKLKEDLNTFLKLEIPHISCYSLIIEDGTILKIKSKKSIDEDIEEKMYRTIENILTKNQYEHYEISNYAKEGFLSKHNLNYWNNEEYYGFGLGAVSYLNHIRINNTRNLTKYLSNNYLEKQCKETKEIRISNELILGLRKIKGISITNFYRKYHIDITTLYNIKNLLEEGLLEIEDNYLKIPSKYIYKSNEILINFI